MKKQIFYLILFYALWGSLGADVAPEPMHEASSLSRKNKHSSPIIMEEEEVFLTLSPGKMDVKVIFYMKNPTRKKIRLEEGFPEGPISGSLKNFKVFHGNKKPDISVKNIHAGKTFKVLGKVLPYEADYWYLWKATYRPGKTEKITVTYSMNLEKDNEYGRTGYILHTGAGWAGNIGKAVVHLKLVDGFSLGHLREVSPLKNFKFNKKKFTWTFKDFEPGKEDDIHVFFNPKLTMKQEIDRSITFQKKHNNFYYLFSSLMMMERARNFRKIDEKRYWKIAEKAMDFMVPDVVGKWNQYVVQLNSDHHSCLQIGSDFFKNFLHRAVLRAAEGKGNKRVLKQIFILMYFWSQDCIFVDRRWLRKRMGSMFKGQDFEVFCKLSKEVKSQVKSDLEAAKRILKTSQP
jgi:hypothetical protein